MVSKLIKYGCDFCTRIYKNKSSAISHEKKCVYNPINRKCGSCNHLWIDIKGLRCGELGKRLFSKSTPTEMLKINEINYPDKCEKWEEVQQ